MKGHQAGRRTGAHSIWGNAEEHGFVQSQEEKAQGEILLQFSPLT